ncbi:MAG: hypothetical protein KDK39_04880 [Leptospiraceae bacterium]|nr:hypothetical protein [Leptospiraceae bacterium]
MMEQLVRRLRWFLRDWKLKLGSLIASGVLFGYIQYTQTIRRTLHVRVKRPELAQGLMFAGKVPSFLNVELSGNAEINNFEASEFKIHLRLSSPPPRTGQENIFRTIMYPALPEGIHARYDEEISVMLDEVLERKIPVVPLVQAALPRSMELGYVKIEPAWIRLVGPRQVLSQMERVTTQAVRLQDQSIYQQQTQIQGTPEFVALARGMGDLVRISAKVYKTADLSNYTKVESVPIVCSNSTGNLEMKVLGGATVDVYIQSEASELEQDQFQAQVFCPVFYDEDTKTINPGFHIKNMPVQIIDKLNRLDVNIIKVSPATVSVQFEKLDESQRRPVDTRRKALQDHLMIQP